MTSGSALVCWYRHTRDLHPFPTRRSSDLQTVGALRRMACLRAERLGVLAELGRPRSRLAGAGDVTAREHAARSEEHTSELQSLTNLVCRLLLEKKKDLRLTMSERYALVAR